MDHDLFRAALLVIGFVVFYAVLARGLFNFTEPLRLKALEIAETLNESAQVSTDRKASLYRRLGEVYSSLKAWKLVLLMLYVIVMLPFGRSPATDQSVNSGVPTNLQGEYNRFKVFWMVSTIANSPAATFIFSLLLILTLAFTASVFVISGALAFAQDHHRSDNQGQKPLSA